MKVLGLGFAGMDIVIDNTLSNIYIVDVNMFPGFPKRKTFNLAWDVIRQIGTVSARRKSRHFKKL